MRSPHGHEQLHIGQCHDPAAHLSSALLVDWLILMAHDPVLNSRQTHALCQHLRTAGQLQGGPESAQLLVQMIHSVVEADVEPLLLSSRLQPLSTSQCWKGHAALSCLLQRLG